MPGSEPPVRSRTTPAWSYSGTSDSIRLNTDSYSATSTICPSPAAAPPVTSRWRSAIMAPITPCRAATESPIDTPTRTGGRSAKPDT